MNWIGRKVEFLTKSIVNNLAELKIIEVENIEIYYFGMIEGIMLMFNILFTLLISLILSDIKTGMIFLFFFAPLRCYAGGFHAKSRRGCFYCSIIFVVIALQGIKLLDSFGIELLIVLFLISYCIGKESPVENINKPLNLNERERFRKKTITILFLEDIVAMIFWRLYASIMNIIVMAQIIEMILIFMTKLEKKNIKCT